MSSRPTRRGGLVRLMRSAPKGELQNSESFHSFALANVVDPKSSLVRVWAATLLSILVLFAQIAIVITVTLDTSEPNCLSSDDCNAGQFCEITGGQGEVGKCADCSVLDPYQADGTTIEPNSELWTSLGSAPGDLSACTAVLATLSAWDSIDATQMCLDCPPGKVAPARSVTDLTCMNYWHCKNNDAIKGKCDYIHLHLTGLRGKGWIILIAMALLLAQPLAADMDESASEELLAEFHSRNWAALEEPPWSMALRHGARLFLLFGFRVRRVILPMLVAGTAAIVMVNAPFTSIDILLNLLAVAFITEIDNLIATFILPAEQLRAAEKLVAAATDAGFTETPHWLAHRAIGLYCAGAIIAMIRSLSIRTLEEDSCIKLDTNIRSLSFALSLFLVVVLFVMELVRRCSATISGDSSDSLAYAILQSVYNFLLNMTAWSFAGAVNFIVAYANDDIASLFSCGDICFYGLTEFGLLGTAFPVIMFVVFLTLTCLAKVATLRLANEGHGGAKIQPGSDGAADVKASDTKVSAFAESDETEKLTN